MAPNTVHVTVFPKKVLSLLRRPPLTNASPYPLSSVIMHAHPHAVIIAELGTSSRA